VNRKGPDMSRLEKLFLINPVPETFLLHYTVNNVNKTIGFNLVWWFWPSTGNYWQV